MKREKLLLTSLLFTLLLMSVPHSALASGKPACVVLLDPGSKAVQQLDKLHTFIDALPDTARLELALLPLDQAQTLQPKPLDREARAALHLRLQEAATRNSLTEREMIAAVQNAIRVLARVPGERLIILASDTVSRSDGWQAAIADATENEVKVVLVTGDANDTDFSHPLVRQTMGKQIGVTGTLLADLIQMCGLLSAELRSSKGQEYAATYTLAPDTLQFTLYATQVPGRNLEVLTPAGRTVVLDEESPGNIYRGTDYTCWHLTKEQALDLGWEGDWSIKAVGQGQTSVWLVDSIELHVEAKVIDGKRLVTTSVWRLGDKLSAAELRGQQFQLLSPDGDALVNLNDAGISGDLVPGDGVFSVALPDHLLPAAGAAIVEAKGRIQRAGTVYVAAVPKLANVPKEPNWHLLSSGILIITGLAGAVLFARQRPADFSLRHVSAAGYHRVTPLGSQPVLAGSGRKCGFKLGAFSAPKQLRFRITRDGVAVDIMAQEPGTYINGERVYLSRILNHGDEVIVGRDTIIFQDRREGRIGRRIAATRQENRPR